MFSARINAGLQIIGFDKSKFIISPEKVIYVLDNTFEEPSPNMSCCHYELLNVAVHITERHGMCEIIDINKKQRTGNKQDHTEFNV